MAKYNLTNYTAADGLGFPKNFRRGNPNPLDNSSVWQSLAAAQNYAQTDPTAYVGQILSVVNYTPAVLDEEGTVVIPSASTVDVYYIKDEAGTLEQVGKSSVGDESTITIAEDGTISLFGIEGLALEREEEDGSKTKINYQPLLVDGKLTWVEPSATTVEGLATEMEGVKTSITNLEQKVAGDIETASKAAEDAAVDRVLGYLAGEEVNVDFDTLKEVAAWIEADTTNSAELIRRVSAIEGDYLKGADKTELQGKIDDLAKFVGTLPEGATSTTVVAYIQEVVDGLKIGDYAKASDLTALADRVKAVEDKLANIADGAQVNVIDSVDEAQFAIDEDKKLTLLNVAVDKVTGLQDALDERVNVVGSVDEAQFALDENKKLTLLEISIDKVTGLQEALDSKAATITPLTNEEIDSIFTT